MNKQLLAAAVLATWLAASLVSLPASAKLPPPSDEAKAKAAEAAAKTAHGNKVAEFQLCKSMDKVAVDYYARAKKEGKTAAPAATTPPCADPGVFVYAPPAPAPAPGSASAPAPAAAVAAAPAPAAAPKK